MESSNGKITIHVMNWKLNGTSKVSWCTNTTVKDMSTYIMTMWVEKVAYMYVM